MALLKDMLVKPYIDVEFDEGDTIRIPAAWSDCRRFVDRWPQLKEELDAQYDERDPKTLLDCEKRLMRLMCGEEAGDRLMRKCLDYLTDGTGLSDEQVSLNVRDVLAYVADLWNEQVRSMAKQHGDHVKSYLRDTDEDAAL